MGSLPITRDQALELLAKHTKDKSDMIHYLESEAIMGALAKEFGEDEAYWKMLGLLHDVDWGLTKENHALHCTMAPDILKQAGFDDRFIQIVLSHGYGWDVSDLKDKKRTEKVEFALAASETVTGLIHAYAILRKGLEGMEVSGVKKRMKEKSFAKNVNRDIIMESEKLGITLDRFLEIAIKALQSIAKEVGF
jgi:uncharacterized protein